MTPEEEKTTIQKVVDGDKNAYEKLVLFNQKNVYNLALKMTGNEEDALDISQEAFFKAYRQLSSFRGESRFSVWLYRLTHNLCIDFLRKKPRSLVTSLTSVDDSGEIRDLEIPDVRNLPEDSAFRSELRREIATSIESLGQKHREIFMMREVAGLSYTEIAGTLSLSEGTVKSRLARARSSLAGILAEKGTFPEYIRHKDRKEVE